MARESDFFDRSDIPLSITDADPKRRSNVWQKLCRVMEVVIYVLLCLSVYKLFGPELERRDALAAQHVVLSGERDALEVKVKRLRTEHRLLKTDKEYLETIARDRLDLQHAGETIIRMERK
ncbi:MAG: septum formation initiator family protein [Verrucomicrobiota bacterium]